MCLRNWPRKDWVRRQALQRLSKAKFKKKNEKMVTSQSEKWKVLERIAHQGNKEKWRDWTRKASGYLNEITCKIIYRTFAREEGRNLNILNALQIGWPGYWGCTIKEHLCCLQLCLCYLFKHYLHQVSKNLLMCLYEHEYLILFDQ